MKSNPKYVFLLLVTAFIWGLAFVAQSVGMEHMQPFTFNAVRSIVGGFVLLPVVFIGKRQRGTPTHAPTQKEKNTLILGGICSGVVLAVAATAQQIGIQYAAVGKAGFLTTLYIIIVPLLGIFLKRMPPMQVWIAVVIALGGLYLLCWKGAEPLGRGDAFLLLCSVLFSLHILVIDHFSGCIDGVCMSCIQFFVAGFLCLIGAFVFEKPTFSAILAGWVPILYTGVLSSGVGFTFQIISQRHVAPTVASLLMSLESVFATLAAWILLHQALSTREIGGCLLMFTAIILAQLPTKTFCRAKKQSAPMK